MAEEYNGLMVYSEDKDTLFELLSKARELADLLRTEVFAVILGEKVEADVLAAYGADRVYIVEKPELKGLFAEACAQALHSVISQVKPEAFFAGATKRGKELAPRVAEMLGTGCVAECVAIDIKNQELKMKRVVFGGKVISTHTITAKPAIATIPPRVFNKKRLECRTAEIVKVEAEISPPMVEIIEVKPKEVLERKIEEAAILICGGRGVKQKEDFKLLDELAYVLGGVIGCSRPIAADRGWFSEWVGLSGKKVRPDLYITAGVSGAIQHVAGIRGSRIVVSINKDPEAPIFAYSDYGIVGDLYKVVPALTEALRETIKSKK
jgi:electron transfer flavoprotein alpha subunit